MGTATPYSSKSKCTSPPQPSVPASLVSLAPVIRQIRDLLTSNVVSHSIIRQGNREYVEVRYLQNQGREYYDYLGNDQVGKMRSSEYVFADHSARQSPRLPPDPDPDPPPEEENPPNNEGEEEIEEIHGEPPPPTPPPGDEPPSDDGGGGVLWCWFSDKVSSGIVALLSSLPKLGGLKGAL